MWVRTCAGAYVRTWIGACVRRCVGGCVHSVSFIVPCHFAKAMHVLRIKYMYMYVTLFRKSKYILKSVLYVMYIVLTEGEASELIMKDRFAQFPTRISRRPAHQIELCYSELGI